MTVRHYTGASADCARVLTPPGEGIRLILYCDDAAVATFVLPPRVCVTLAADLLNAACQQEFNP
jgi:hypothetical protein